MDLQYVRRLLVANRGEIIRAVVLVVLTILSVLYIANLSPYRNIPGSDAPIYVRATVVTEPIVQPMQNVTKIAQQIITAKLKDGPDTGLRTEVSRTVFVNDQRDVAMPVGSTILLSKSEGQGNYNYVNRYHIPGLAILLGIVVLLVMFIGRWRGFTGVVGLLVGMCVLFVFVVPRILSGEDAFITCVQGAFMIAAATILIAHGVNKRTSVALLATSAILLFVILGVWLTSYLVGLVGYYGNEVSGLQQAAKPISIYGLIAGGMLIAVLGVLDDITTGQSAVIDEIHKANRSLKSKELYTKGLSVGREHVASLVNTLVLVYVGVSLPTIVLAQLYFDGPLLVFLNYEVIALEILRSLVTSASLLIAVPVSTALAAYILPRWYAKSKQKGLKPSS